MKKRGLLFFFWIGANVFVIGQVGRVGINTTTPAAILHVKDSSVLFTGLNSLPASPGAPPVSGAGTRMMWYPDKAAFCAGRITNTYWNKDSTGTYSIAMGNNVEAKGTGSLAVGDNCRALGNYSVAIGIQALASGNQSFSLGAGTISSGISSTAMGNFTQATASVATSMGAQTIASEQYSTAMGLFSKATEYASTAMGNNSKASGNSSTAMGNNTIASAPNATSTGLLTQAKGSQSFTMGNSSIANGDDALSIGNVTKAKSFCSLVLGQYNDTTSISSTTWNNVDPVFIIGNGSSNNVRTNAMTVLKNGNVSIGPDVSPVNRLLISNNNSGDGGWLEGIMVESTSANTGEAAVAMKNIAIPAGKQWIVGLNQNPTLAFNYGTNFAGGNNKMSIDTSGNVGIGISAPATDLHIKGAIAVNNYNNPPFTSVSNNDPIIVDDKTYIRVSTGTVVGGQDISLNLSDGIATGQILILQRTEGIASNNLVIYDTESNIDLTGTFVVLNLNDTITFIWDGDEWVELHRSNN
jgi:hypothetical protein